MQIFEIFEIFSKDNNVESNLRVELELGYNVAIKIFFKDIWNLVKSNQVTVSLLRWIFLKGKNLLYDY